MGTTHPVQTGGNLQDSHLEVAAASRAQVADDAGTQGVGDGDIEKEIDAAADRAVEIEINVEVVADIESEAEADEADAGAD